MPRLGANILAIASRWADDGRLEIVYVAHPTTYSEIGAEKVPQTGFRRTSIVPCSSGVDTVKMGFRRTMKRFLRSEKAYSDVSLG